MNTRARTAEQMMSFAAHQTARHRSALELRRDATDLARTHNHTGYISRYLDPVTDEFIRFSGASRATCLEIGAGFGAASWAAVEAGARQAIVTDPQKSHLTAHLPYVDTDKMCTIRVGGVPNGISVPKGSVDAILIARVLHFLPGKQVRAAIENCSRWLKPGGRIFVVCDSIHAKQFAPLRARYRKRKRELVDSPGYFKRMGAVHKERRKDLPDAFHYFERNTLQSFFRKRQFLVTSLAYFGRPDYPISKKKDGRECVGLIAERL